MDRRKGKWEEGKNAKREKEWDNKGEVGLEREEEWKWERQKRRVRGRVNVNGRKGKNRKISMCVRACVV